MPLTKEVLLEDPRLDGLPAAIRAGELVFFSAIDGHVKGMSQEVDVESFGDGLAQARNAYETLAARLEAVGLTPRHAVRCEHVRHSQVYRLPGLKLLPDIFGTPTQIVAQGYEGKFNAPNKITITPIAYTGPVEDIEVITPGPTEQRASRVTRAGSFVFIIGVGGNLRLAQTKDISLGPGHDDLWNDFQQQVHNAYENVEHHLASAGLTRANLLRFDGYLRDIDLAMEHRDLRTKYFEGQMSVASTVVASLTVGTGFIELSSMAGVAGKPIDVKLAAGRQDLARSVGYEGLVFASGMLGNRNVSGKLEPESYGDMIAQLNLAADRTDDILGEHGSSLEDTVRLDVYVKNPYRRSQIISWVKDRFGDNAPTVNIYGVELEPTAEAELTAIAVSRS
jgi:enamine deaminase RidA (YjgF/YER057c/UK114 family)